MIPRCYGYCRVSTESQADDNRTSIADQKKAITAKATAMGLAVDEWFVDPGASGATPNRPGFQAMLAACRANPRSRRDPGFVIALNISRFGRFDDVSDHAYWRGAFRQLKWDVVFVEGDTETKDPFAREIIRLATGAQATEYRRVIQAQAIRGARGTANQGFWTSRAPYGYRRKVVYPPGRERVLDNSVRKATDEKVKLAPETIEAEIVRQAFERYLQPRETLESVAEWMQQFPRLEMTSSRAVRWMFQNKAYLGHVEIGRRMADEEDPKRVVRRQTAERWGVMDAHPAIVSQDLFDRVAAKLAANAAAPRRANSDYLLTGIMTCAHCGEPLIGGGNSGVGQHIYRCSGTLKRIKVCTVGGVITAKIIDPLVIDTLAAVMSQPSWQRMVREYTERRLDELASTSGDDARVDAELKRLNAAKERVARLVVQEVLDPDDAKGRLDRIRGEMRRLEEAKVHQRIADARRATIAQERETIVQKVLDAPARLRAAKGPALRELIGFWCQSLSYNKAQRKVRIAVRTVIPVLMASTVVAVFPPSSSS